MDLTQLIFDAADKYGIPRNELLAIKRNETGSGTGIGEISKAGAIGPMQLMPATARELGVDPHDPAQNIDGGARYYAQMRQQFGSPVLAAAAYNAGPGGVHRYLNGSILPAETQGYIAKFQRQLTDEGPQPGLSFGGLPSTRINVPRPFPGNESAPAFNAPGLPVQSQQQQLPGAAAMGGGTGSLYPQFPNAPNVGFLQPPQQPPRQPLNLSNLQALLPRPLPTMQNGFRITAADEQPSTPLQIRLNQMLYDRNIMRKQGMDVYGDDWAAHNAQIRLLREQIKTQGNN